GATLRRGVSVQASPYDPGITDLRPHSAGRVGRSFPLEMNAKYTMPWAATPREPRRDQATSSSDLALSGRGRYSDATGRRSTLAGTADLAAGIRPDVGRARDAVLGNLEPPDHCLREPAGELFEQHGSVMPSHFVAPTLEPLILPGG